MPTHDTLTRGMALLAQLWPHRTVDADTLDAYTFALQDLTDEEFRLGVMTCVSGLRDGGKFFPLPAEIRLAGRPLPTDTQIAEVFALVNAFASTYDSQRGRYTWRADDVETLAGPVARAAFIAAGGDNAFHGLGQSYANHPHVLRRFTEAYLEAWRTDQTVKLAEISGIDTTPLIASTARALSATRSRLKELKP